MNVCVVCCDKAISLCKPCKVAFCKEHKGLHENSKIRKHSFEEIGRILDTAQYEKVVKNLTLKINKVKEFKERIILESKSLILKINELCMKSLEIAEKKVQYYINLLQASHRPLLEKDLKLLEDQIAIPVIHNISGLNSKEIHEFYQNEFLPELIQDEFSKIVKRNMILWGFKITEDLVKEIQIMPLQQTLKNMFESLNPTLANKRSLIAFEKHPLSSKIYDRINAAIYRGTLRDKSIVAVKIYTAIGLDFSPEDLYAIQEEIEILTATSRHATEGSCFIKFLGEARWGNSIALYMESHKKNLMDMISGWKKKLDKPKRHVLEEWIISLIISFTRLNNMLIYHGDIKPHNILITEDQKLKIIEFRTSKMRLDARKKISLTGKYLIQGTRGYMAPELEELLAKGIKEIEYYPEKSEVFSLGMTIFQIITYDDDVRSLGSKQNNIKLIATVASLNSSDWLKKMLTGMLAVDRNQRFTFNECTMFLPGRTL